MTDRLFSGTLVPASKKLSGIHGLRAVAALMVMVPHIWLYGGMPPSPQMQMLTDICSFGVQLFFVLSAFSLANSEERGQWFAYAIKRFFRIAPLFYAMLIFYQVMNRPLSISANLVNLTFIFNIVPGAFRSGVWGGWSVGVEMLFYAALPLILIVCRTRWDYLSLAVVGTIASWAAHRFLFNADLTAAKSIMNNYAFYAAPSNIAPFCFGLLAFSFYRSTSDSEKLATIGAVSFLLMMALLIFSPLIDATRTADRPGALVLFAAFGMLCIWQAVRPSWLLRQPVAQYFGDRSFSLYLVQFPIMKELAPIYRVLFHDAGVAGFLLSLPLSVIIVSAVAEITYRAIEVPGVNIGRRLAAQFRIAPPPLPRFRSSSP